MLLALPFWRKKKSVKIPFKVWKFQDFQIKKNIPYFYTNLEFKKVGRSMELDEEKLGKIKK